MEAKQRKQFPLGKKLNIPATAEVHQYDGTFTRTYYGNTVELIIGIGEGSVAYLTMNEECYNDFIKGKKLIFK